MNKRNKPRSKERGKGKKDSKTAYIHMRVLPSDKFLLETMAHDAGQSLSEYLVSKGLQGIEK